MALLAGQASGFRAATDDGVIRTAMPRVKIPKKPREQVVPLEPETVRALIDATPARYRTAIVLAASTGMRQGEVLGLTVATDRGRGDTRRHVEQYGTDPDGLVFTNEWGEPIKRNSFSVVWRPAADADVRTDARPSDRRTTPSPFAAGSKALERFGQVHRLHVERLAAVEHVELSQDLVGARREPAATVGCRHPRRVAARRGRRATLRTRSRWSACSMDYRGVLPPARFRSSRASAVFDHRTCAAFDARSCCCVRELPSSTGSRI
jgi:integrase